VVGDGNEVLRRLVAQVTSPVRWDLCMATMAAHGATAIVELPPAGTLTGLAKRELKGTPTLALKTPADLDTAIELIKQEGQEQS
jgi:[acyl-carrier-protein] S-malonyltransferase